MDPSAARTEVPPWTRPTSKVWLVGYLSWYLAAPLAQRWLGNPDFAAWLPLFLLPTTLIGGVFGVWLCLSWSRRRAMIQCLLSVAHLAVGTGLFDLFD